MAAPACSIVPDTGSGPMYQATGTIIQVADQRPQMCFSELQSLPPQCGFGIPVRNLSWKDVAPERRGGITWLHAKVIGRYRNGVFYLNFRPGPPQQQNVEPSPGPPCSPPAGGWAVVNQALASNAQFNSMRQFIRTDGAFTGEWIVPNILRGTTPRSANDLYVAGFTGDLERHQRDIQDRWGGPVCVISQAHPHHELEAIATKVFAHQDKRRGLLFDGVGVNDVHNTVDVHSVIASADNQAVMDKTFGPGAVRLIGMLRVVTV